jgi:hypothetical protein
MPIYSKAAAGNEHNFAFWSSATDPFPPIALLQSGQSAKSGYCEQDDRKADFGDLNQAANCRLL